MSADGYFHVPRRLMAARIPNERKLALVWMISQASYTERQVGKATLRVGETPVLPLSLFEQEFKWTRKTARVFLEYAQSPKCLEETGVRVKTGQLIQGHALGHALGHTYLIGLAKYRADEGHTKGHALGHANKEEKEGKKDSKKISTGRSAPARSVNLNYSPIFLEAFALMPYRGGHNNPKAAAWRAWCARIREGEAEERMLASASRYGEFCDATNLSGTQHAMQAATFFGPGRPYEQDWEIPEFHTNGNGNGRHK